MIRSILRLIKYIFSINAGRSGSKYLAELFSHVENCSAQHEAVPVLNGSFIRNFNNRKNSSQLQKKMEKKYRAIEKQKSDHSLYVETNHTFIKGFGWMIPEYIPQNEIGVIILKRDRKRIIESLLSLRCTPLTYIGKNWLFLPTDKTRCLDINKGQKSFILKYHLFKWVNLFYLKFEHLLGMKPSYIENFEVDLLNYYLDEMDARTIAFRKKWPEISYYETTINELNKPGAVDSILQYFKIYTDVKQSIAPIINRPTNIKSYVSS